MEPQCTRRSLFPSNGALQRIQTCPSVEHILLLCLAESWFACKERRHFAFRLSIFPRQSLVLSSARDRSVSLRWKALRWRKARRGRRRAFSPQRPPPHVFELLQADFRFSITISPPLWVHRLLARSWFVCRAVRSFAQLRYNPFPDSTLNSPKTAPKVNSCLPETLRQPSRPILCIHLRRTPRTRLFPSCISFSWVNACTAAALHNSLLYIRPAETLFPSDTKVFLRTTKTLAVGG